MDDKMEKVKLAAAKSALKALKSEDASKLADALSVFFSACSDNSDEEDMSESNSEDDETY